jgi:hypothetical protein
MITKAHAHMGTQTKNRKLERGASRERREEEGERARGRGCLVPSVIWY